MTDDQYNHWKSKIKPMGQSRIEILFSATLTSTDIATMKNGLLPASMDDKWIGFLSDDGLNFYRSWTGHQIYHLPIKPVENGYSAGPIYVMNEPDIYRRQNDELDLKIVKMMIERMKA